MKRNATPLAIRRAPTATFEPRTAGSSGSGTNVSVTLTRRSSRWRSRDAPLARDHARAEVGDRGTIGHAVAVRVGVDRRDPLEVVDRHGRRQLPLERERLPRVGLGALAPQHDRPDEVAE